MRRSGGQLRPAGPRASPEIDAEPFETLGVLARDPDYGIGNRVEFVSTKAGRDQDDTGVLDVACDRIVSEREKVDDVGGDDRPASSARLSELRAVVELDPAHLVRAHRIDTLVAQEPSDNRRHVLVEVDLHSVVTNTGDVDRGLLRLVRRRAVTSTSKTQKITAVWHFSAASAQSWSNPA